MATSQGERVNTVLGSETGRVKSQGYRPYLAAIFITSHADIDEFYAARSPSSVSLWSLKGGSSSAEAYAHLGANRDIPAGTAEFEDHEPISGSSDRQMRAGNRDCGSAYYAGVGKRSFADRHIGYRHSRKPHVFDADLTRSARPFSAGFCEPFRGTDKEECSTLGGAEASIVWSGTVKSSRSRAASATCRSPLSRSSKALIRS